jgi:hypothetical protein
MTLKPADFTVSLKALSVSSSGVNVSDRPTASFPVWGGNTSQSGKCHRLWGNARAITPSIARASVVEVKAECTIPTCGAAG